MDYSFTYDEVFTAFDDCLKHKKNTIGAKEFCGDCGFDSHLQYTTGKLSTTYLWKCRDTR